MAVGTLAVRRSRGVGMPDRVSVVGVDDMPADVTPALAMVRLPLVEMGARAMTLGLQQPPEDGDPHIERVDAELVRRDSVAPPRW